MTVTCPHCHRPYDPPLLDVDLTHNSMIIDGVAHRLQPQLMEIFTILLDGYPRVVTFDHLAARLWGAGEGPENERGTMKVQCANLRKALGGTGWTVRNTHSVGYRLVEVRA